MLNAARDAAGQTGTRLRPARSARRPSLTCSHGWSGFAIGETLPNPDHLAIELGVPKDRIDTIVDFAAAQQYGVKSEGSQEGRNSRVLAELAGLVAESKLDMPVAATFPLANVRAAFRQLEQGHTRGKIVLRAVTAVTAGAQNNRPATNLNDVGSGSLVFMGVRARAQAELALRGGLDPFAMRPRMTAVCAFLLYRDGPGTAAKGRGRSIPERLAIVSEWRKARLS
jgi:hypothetical protein